MKKILDAILVVEGKSDVSYLSNYIDCEYVITNGSEVSKDTINYLKTASKSKRIIVLTDPDYPGKRIRTLLDENIDNLEHAFISKDKAIKHGKVGVAECDIDEIMNALSKCFVNKKIEVETISINDLYELKLLGSINSKELREKLSSKLGLGFNNAKSLYKRLNSVKLTKEDIQKLL